MTATMCYIRANKKDLYRVLIPTVIAFVMAPSSLSGAAAFLICWAAIRMAGLG